MFYRRVDIIDNYRKDERASRSILAELYEYTECHLQREEVLMKSCNYHYLSQHQKIHQALLKGIKQQMVLFENKELIDGELLIFLSDWLLGHIEHEDKITSAYCEGKEEDISWALGQVLK